MHARSFSARDDGVRDQVWCPCTHIFPLTFDISKLPDRLGYTLSLPLCKLFFHFLFYFDSPIIK